MPPQTPPNKGRVFATSSSTKKGRGLTRPLSSSLAPQLHSLVAESKPSSSSKSSPVVKGKSTKLSPDRISKPAGVRSEGAHRRTTLKKMKFTPAGNNAKVVHSMDNDDGSDVKMAEDDESGYEESHEVVGPNHPSVPKALNNIIKSKKKILGPPDPNGRLKGRKLVMWHRPRMMEKLLLTIQYECYRKDITLPWDDIVHRLRPGSSGPCATQMLMKMKDILLLEGHMVPPFLGKPGVKEDPSIRGFVRDEKTENSLDPKDFQTRIVRWDEALEDRKESLKTPGITIGSGRYDRGKDKNSSITALKRSDVRRARVPQEVRDVMGPWREGDGAKNLKKSSSGSEKDQKAQIQPAAKDSKKTQHDSKTKPKKSRTHSFNRRQAKDSDESESVDTAKGGHGPDSSDLDSDDDYHPTCKFKKSRVRSRKPVRAKAIKSANESFSEDDLVDLSQPHCRTGIDENPPKAKLSLLVKLHLSPNKLAKILPGRLDALPPLNKDDMKNESTEFRTPTYTGDEFDADDEQYDEDDEDIRELFKAGFGDDIQNGRYDLSYQGPEMHGSLEQFNQAWAAGLDPRINGSNYIKDLAEIGEVSDDDAFSEVLDHRFGNMDIESPLSHVTPRVDALTRGVSSQLGRASSSCLPLNENPFIDQAGRSSFRPYLAQPGVDDHPVYQRQSIKDGRLELFPQAGNFVQISGTRYQDANQSDFFDGDYQANQLPRTPLQNPHASAFYQQSPYDEHDGNEASNGALFSGF